MSSLVVVLGMHRSGTSCVTQVLQQAGLYLGTDLMSQPSADNLGGHWETWEAVRINDRILQLSGGAWDRLPPTPRGDDETAVRIRQFLNALTVRPVAGWKDPRTTFTFPVWQPHLSNYRLVACLRHPLSVARSLQVRNGWPLEWGLSLWAAYNECLERLVANEAGKVWWFDFDLPTPELLAVLRELCRRTGLRWDPSLTGTFIPLLRHHAHRDWAPDPRMQALYERLRERSRSDSRRARGRPRTAAAAAGRLADRSAVKEDVQRLLRGDRTVAPPRPGTPGETDLA
jgi:hypothetical protein